ncbi:hypothetical protein BU16DRAFT_465941 [Lophium mytilinum]|uniref:Zn(2)-C6 fungal-type domain-containing protein n=1 Tax=Lophium mytilinum TaxID=390894 RepID=A0A6A6QKG0_9PEZI|nr:hypothetical protein BU16DRAFT_465941 [Lophium mytilinum]
MAAGPASPADEELMDDGPQKRTRTRNGCLNCRLRRKKCNEIKPCCSNCQKRGEACEWRTQLSFRTENAHNIQDDHPSMKCGRARKRPRQYEILDVTSEIVRDYWRENSFLETAIDWNEDLAIESSHTFRISDTPPSQNHAFERPTTKSTRKARVSASTADYPVPELQQTYSNPTTSDIVFGSPPFQPTNTLLSPGFATEAESSTTSPNSQRLAYTASPNSQSFAHTAATNLLSLRDTQPHMTSPHVSDIPIQLGDAQHHGTPIEPDIFDYGDPLFEDGLFIPGSTYLELHSTLRTHIINTARSNAPSRHVSPGLESVTHAHSAPTWNPSRRSSATLPDLQPQNGIYKAVDLPPLEEYELWKNWIDEVAPWLDKFDNQRHFEHMLPLMAKSHTHLKYSILALSARQLERKEMNRKSSRSLALYQEAIHHLLPQLQTRNTAVIASCVVLCVLEMLSCSPKEWRRHLDGCASLMEAVGINGCVGGVEQALFWCFARMDVCGGLISSERTLIPARHWASRTNIENDVHAFRSSPGFDTYANFAVFLMAEALDLFANPVSESIYESRWLQLFNYIEDWYSERPEEMKAIVCIPADTNENRPFPTLLFGNGPAVSGNQLYHTAALLMLQKRPRSTKLLKKPRSILWHARQICAISISNTHHGCWTNAIQPLWIAGQVMSHPSEHKAILEAYERIEHETGWGTKWRMDDLKEYWGDLSD